MELKQLQYFLAVVEYGGLSRAAEHLGLTQQAISKSMLALEASAGAKLLERRGRVVRPTSHGLLLLTHARSITRELANFDEALRRRQGGRRGRVRIGTSPTATAPIVTPAIRAVLDERPQMRLEVTAGLRRDLLAQLVEGRLDVAVCLDIEQHHDPGLTREVLCHDEYAVVAGRRNPLGRRDDVEVADLVDWPWILGRNLGDVAAAWRSVWASAGLPAPTPAVETSSLDFCRLALPDSRYLTILPRGLIAADVTARRLQIIPVSAFAWERPIALYYREPAARAAETAALIGALRAAAGLWRS